MKAFLAFVVAALGYWGFETTFDVKKIPDTSPISIDRKTEPPPPVVTYDDEYIQAAIGATAEEASDKTVNLPAGTYLLDSQITIPSGTVNLTINGAGVGSTIFEVQPGVSTPVVRIGFYNIFTNADILLEDVSAEDADVVTKALESAPTVGNYYILKDSNVVKHANDGTQIGNRRELVKVSSVTGTGPYTVTLDYAGSPTGIDASLELTGAARDYSTTSARLSTPAQPISQNISISGIEIRGGGKAHIFQAGGCDGVTISNCKVSNWLTGAYYFLQCRDITVSGCTASGAATGSSGGGYGIWLQSCREAIISSCTGLKGDTGLLRHFTIMHGGTTDVLITGCTTDGGDYDCHGMDERRIHLKNCTRTGVSRINVALGNDVWLGGDKDILVEDCDVYGNLYLQNGVDGLVVSGGHFNNVRIQSRFDADAIPTDGVNGTNTISGATFDGDGSQNLLIGWSNKETGNLTRMGDLTFDTCTLNLATSADFRRMFFASPTDAVGAEWTGSLTINNCPIVRSGNANPRVPFRIGAGATRDFSFIFTNNTITSHSSAAVQLDDPWLSGTVTITGNTFHSTGAAAAVVTDNNTAGPSKTISGNTLAD